MEVVGSTCRSVGGAQRTFPSGALGRGKRGACPWEPSGTREGNPGVIYMALELEKKLL